MTHPSAPLRTALRSVVVAGLAALPSPAQKVPDTRVNAAPPATRQRESPRIVASGSEVYVVWEDFDIHFNRSADGGATWLPADVRLNELLTSAGPPGIALSGPAVYVTWDNFFNFDTNIYVNRSLDGGATWLASEVRVDRGPAGSYARFPEIAASGSDAYVVWEDDRLGGFRAADIHFNRSLDGGITWLPADIRLSTGAAPSAAESAEPVVVASGSAVYVTWQEWPQSSSLPDVWFTRSLDKGLTWIDPPTLRATDSDAPRVAASGSSVFLVWSDRRNGNADIYFNRSLDRGTTWLHSDIRLDTDPPGSAHSFGPKIAISGSSVHVAWEDQRNHSRNQDIYFNRSLDGGLTWLGSDIRLDTDPAGSTRSTETRIAASGSSVYVTWSDFGVTNLPPPSDIYVNRSLDGGTTWLASAVRLNTDTPGVDASWMPQVAASGASAYVTWVDERNWNGVGFPAKSDIYFNIPFGFQPYGAPTPGSGGLPPALSGAGSATMGSTPSIDVTGGLGGAAGALFLGVGPASKVSIPVLGGTILVQPALGLPLVLGGAAGVPGAGSASLPLPLPNLPSAVGVNLNFQGLFLDAGAVLGISMTNAIEMWIG